MGFDNQGETFVVWDKDTGQPLTPAIVWQDKRAAPWCETQRANIDADWLRGRWTAPGVDRGRDFASTADDRQILLFSLQPGFLGRRAGQLALLAAAAEIAASTLDVERLLDSIARYIQRSFGYYSVAVYLVDAEQRSAFMAGAAVRLGE